MITFAECNDNVKEALNLIHQTSPFKKGNLCQKQQQLLKNSFTQHRRKELVKSFHSEDVQDTVEEVEPTTHEEIKHLDNVEVIDSSVNKSHLTFEDNNKAQKQTRRSSLEDKKIDQNYNQNDKVFALRMDDFQHDTSFDTLNTDNLFVTGTDHDITPSLQQQISSYRKMTKYDITADDAMIEKELKQINKNLNTFTVEHFNNLRLNIQKIGFQNAAHKAKRDFNLITAESTTTLMSIKEEDNEVTQTEESRMQSKLHSVYAHNTTASKNLLNKHDLTNKKTPHVIEEPTIQEENSMLNRKVLICEEIT